jgi:hypothetical protein
MRNVINQSGDISSGGTASARQWINGLGLYRQSNRTGQNEGADFLCFLVFQAAQIASVYRCFFK